MRYYDYEHYFKSLQQYTAQLLLLFYVFLCVCVCACVHACVFVCVCISVCVCAYLCVTCPDLRYLCGFPTACLSNDDGSGHLGHFCHQVVLHTEDGQLPPEGL